MADSSGSTARGWVGKALASLARLPDSMVLAVDGWRERSRLRRELDTLCRHGDLERTLADSSIAPSDLPRLMRAHPRTLRQLAEMMQLLGIDRAALARDGAVAQALRAIEWQCGECADWRACRAWLASPDAAESHREFCPNAEAFVQLRAAATPTQEA
ncbi:MAG TPA: DUF6455 family protein [Stellaceae bacterium]|nr:DUF6455 family protein [Stellaceae bacterium]